ncbi:MAG: serine/threonine protein kinase [Polyangiaceae bacterium]|nr:serine/threonine protein kinase [Polyangiaceae bacterium]
MGSTTESRPGRSTSRGGAFVRLGGSSAEGFDSALAERVRLYLKVTFFLNLAFTCVFAITLLTGEGDAAWELRTGLLIGATTAANGLAWFLVARSPGRVGSSPFIASLTTVVLTGVITHLAFSNTSDPNPSRTTFFNLTIVTVILVLRSSLVPSPTLATGVVGLLTLAYPTYLTNQVAGRADPVFMIWYVAISLSVVAVTMLTSSTIYGLDRRMRAAKHLGQYQLEHLLGRGGMGEVYLAKHALLQRPTAIKLLRDVSTARNRDQFRREVQTASSLSHPNTVEIYDYGKTPEGVFYFAMEYVEGATLEEVIKATGAMPPARVIHLLLQAAGALGEAHQRGLVHRDIKPSNLMLCERGGVPDTLKVMDFGLVRDVGDETANSSDGLSGTPLYLAPEAILENDSGIPQSDVYALGATAYFLLSGTPPFASSSLVELLSDHLVRLPAALECSDPSLESLVLRCLAKDPADRPSDALDFADELRRCARTSDWQARDARIWWAEHQEAVFAARSAAARSTGGRTSNRRSSMHH